MKIEISEYRTEDRDQVIALWEKNLSTSKPWQEPKTKIQNALLHNSVFLIARDADRVVGTAVGGFDGIRGNLYSVVVSKPHRLRGIGAELVETVIGRLRRLGCGKVNLQIVSENSNVISFYEKLGFEREDRVSMGRPLWSKSVIEDPLDPAPDLSINERFCLSQPRIADRDCLVKHLSGTRVFNERTKLIPYPYETIHAEVWLITNALSTFEYTQSVSWVIRNQSADPIGSCGLRGIQPNAFAEIGYWLATEYWGQGIMPSAIATICEYGFETYGLQRIFAQTLPDNRPSQRCLEKAGFTFEGNIPKHSYHRGEVVDVAYYGRVKGEK